MKTILWKLCIFFGIIILNTEFLIAASQNTISIPYEYNSKNSLKFINYLIINKKFYRANAELRRYKFFFKKNIYAEKVRVTELMLMYYNNLISDEYFSRENKLLPVEKIFISDYYYKNNNFDMIPKLLNHRDIKNNEIKNIYKKRILAVNILNNKFHENKDLYNDKNFFNKYNYLEEYAQNEYMHMKSTGFALFSGLFPGMGYLYAGKTGTGIISLILISAFSFITYGAWKSDNKPVAVFTGTIGTFFYGGSIIGGYLQSREYNQILKDDLKKYLGKELNFADDHQVIYQKYGIGQYFE